MGFQDRCGLKVILGAHHDPARQNPDRPFKNAHMDVQFEQVYIFAVQKHPNEGDHGWVIGAEEFLHVYQT